MDDKSANSERRRYPRIPFREVCFIEYLEEDGREQDFQPSRDLSLRGIAMEVNKKFEIGRTIYLHVGAEPEPLKIKGKVAYCAPDKEREGWFLMGVEFQVISIEDAEKLNQIISNSSQE